VAATNRLLTLAILAIAIGILLVRLGIGEVVPFLLGAGSG
jgi:hypothetical protein